MEKKAALNGVNLGDIIRCSNGKEYEFIRLKQAKFLGKNNGVTYDIPIEMFVEVARRSNKVPFDVTTLREGDLFYIMNNTQEPICYRFKYMINANKVQAENPVTGQGARMGAHMVVGTVRSLQR